MSNDDIKKAIAVNTIVGVIWISQSLLDTK